MGAWGSGSFENDTALDWAAGARSVDDVRRPFERLKVCTDGHQGEGEFIVDADFGCELLAAAECVALMLGRRARDFPDDLAERLSEAGEPDSLLFHQARNAVLHVMRNSELAELWEETARESRINEWLVELTGLIERLNPDVQQPETWPLVIAGQEQASPADVMGACAFCGKDVERRHLWGMNIHDPFDLTGLSNKSFWLHLRCLNARMHHKHAVADIKFDLDNMPDLDKL